MDSPTDGSRSDVSNTGLKVPVLVAIACATLLVVLIVLAATLT